LAADGTENSYVPPEFFSMLTLAPFGSRRRQNPRP
jgi:hypothetical protein